MKPIINKFIKFFKLIILVFLIVIIVFIAFVEFFPDNSYKGNSNDLNFIDKAAAKLEKIGVFDLIFGELRFRTPKEHQKIFGIETAEISAEEKKKLNHIISESVKVQLDYYSKKNEGVLEKVRNLYLPKEFEKYKEYIKKVNTENKNQSYDNIEIIKFSKPRTYKILPDRIGIVNLIKFKGEYVNYLEQLFIFRNTNSEWKIEKQRKVDIRLDWTESMLIKEISENK